jgi:dipeptidase
MPASYMVDGRERFRRDCAWWAFRQASQLAFLRWQDMTRDIEKVWRPIEDKAFADQAKVEEEALALYKQDPKKAREFLTKYSHGIASGRWVRTGSWPRICGQVYEFLLTIVGAGGLGLGAWG